MMAVLLACRLAMPGDSSLKSTPRLLAWTPLALEQTCGDAACIAALTDKEQHCAAFKAIICSRKLGLVKLCPTLRSSSRVSGNG